MSQEERFAFSLPYMLSQLEEVRTNPEIKLLDLVMPNGRRMRDCTGEEMRVFGEMLTREAERVEAGKDA
jgi:hypothetical protein